MIITSKIGAISANSIITFPSCLSEKRPRRRAVSWRLFVEPQEIEIGNSLT
jgi:hypothetical protein